MARDKSSHQWLVGKCSEVRVQVVCVEGIFGDLMVSVVYLNRILRELRATRCGVSQGPRFMVLSEGFDVFVGVAECLS